MLLELATLPSPLALQDPAAGAELGDGPRTNASCSSDFNWARSSVGTSPCLIAAEVLGACSGSDWDLPSLLDGMDYAPPNLTTANPCFWFLYSSWSAYNLLSACSACQGYEHRIYDWTAYQLICSPLGLSDVYFPENISSHVLIPYWATLNPSFWPNYRFNVIDARLRASQNLSDSVPRTANWQSFMIREGSSSTAGVVIGVIGVIGGLAGIVFMFDIVLYMIYRKMRGHPENYNHQIALIPPPSRRRAHASPSPNPRRDTALPDSRLQYTPIYI
ncbi:hypothetical protein BDZ94DRAFT_1305831 [Collybia nuda]|uniref:Uncharacterized protein n=1 Tax=Collybia nuda TaxID=64659 RepID=A0A9P5YBL2_9AGAR|nr:hypothetical protein BDZ94DRAFT_1305831 [Collybia nuda]